MNWQENLIVNSSDIRALVARSHRVAVLGIKTEAQADQPAFYVPKYLAEVGCEVIPVPVYYPEAEEILGKPVYLRPMDSPGRSDPSEAGRQSPVLSTTH